MEKKRDHVWSLIYILNIPGFPGNNLVLFYKQAKFNSELIVDGFVAKVIKK